MVFLLWLVGSRRDPDFPARRPLGMYLYFASKVAVTVVATWEKGMFHQFRRTKEAPRSYVVSEITNGC